MASWPRPPAAPRHPEALERWPVAPAPTTQPWQKETREQKDFAWMYFTYAILRAVPSRVLEQSILETLTCRLDLAEFVDVGISEHTRKVCECLNSPSSRPI